MEFINSSSYFVPVFLGDYVKFNKGIGKDPNWEQVSNDTIKLPYLMNYVTDLAHDPKKYAEYHYTDLGKVSETLFTGKMFSQKSTAVKLLDVRFSCFSTDIGFLEFRISYGDMSLYEIADFAYEFKKAKKSGMYETAKKLAALTGEEKIFFTSTVDFKYECMCFHMIMAEGVPEKELEAGLNLLKRTYSSGFADGRNSENDPDMIYRPYAYDNWAGSQEGLVNIVTDAGPGNTQANFYLKNYLYENLTSDYRMLYLLLLDQRFCALKCIADIASTDDKETKRLEHLEKMIIRLKTEFSFRVLSDDMQYQNIYSMMYEILNIDSLLTDIHENESRMAALKSAEMAKTESITNLVLFCLSILSVFSALIDAASYFDRFEHLTEISTVLSIFGAVVLPCAVFVVIFAKRKRK